MKSKKTVVSIAISSAFAVSLSAVPTVSAAENPFMAQVLEKGYMVTDASAHGEKKSGEGKCGESKCGAFMADSNKDGKVTKEEWTKHHDVMFEKMDVNKDGVIEKSEIEKMKDEKGRKEMRHGDENDKRGSPHENKKGY